MITCKLGGKEYHIDFISGRALREIGAAQKAYRQIIAAAEAVQKGETAEDDQGEKRQRKIVPLAGLISDGTNFSFSEFPSKCPCSLISVPSPK